MKKPRPSEYKKKPKPSAQQELYARVKAETGNTALAKAEAGYSQNYPTKLLEHTDTMEIALEKQKQIVQDKFMKRAEEMADQMYHLALNARSDQVKFQATKDLLDRAGFAVKNQSQGLHIANSKIVAFVLDKFTSSLCSLAVPRSAL